MALEERGGPLVEPPYRYESSAWVSARLAEILPLAPSARQGLMELDSGLERLAILHGLLAPHGAGEGA